MSLRRRISFVAAAAVAIAIVLAACVSYFVVRGELRGQVDGALKAQAAAVQTNGPRALGQPVPSIPASAGGPAPYVQIAFADGSSPDVVVGNLQLPVDAHALAAANGGTTTYLGDMWVDGNHLRVLTLPATLTLSNGQMETVAIQLARPLGPTDHLLSQLRLILLLLVAGGIALAAALGRVAATRVLAPLSEVTQAAQQIGETDDLSTRLVVHSDDEVGQLATRFNAMLASLQASRAALDDSVRAQRQLVADASHELRTPVTSLRTNIEVLLANPDLDEDERRRLLDDVVEQSDELTGLVGDLIELARGDLPAGSMEDTRLDRIVAEAVTRGRRNSPGIHFDTELEPVIVEGVPERLGRAVNNLLDNAARHSPPDGTIQVIVDARGVRVRDHGPGIAPQDLPHVFDRFFRGAHSRGQQGSGLGLSIVRQVTEQHGGTAEAENAPGGGAIFTLRLPTVPTEQPPTPAGAASPDLAAPRS